MTRAEALEKMSKVTPKDEPWYLNKNLLWTTAFDNVYRVIAAHPDGELAAWMSKRVSQVLKNKKIKTCPNCGHEL